MRHFHWLTVFFWLLILQKLEVHLNFVAGILWDCSSPVGNNFLSGSCSACFFEHIVLYSASCFQEGIIFLCNVQSLRYPPLWSHQCDKGIPANRSFLSQTSLHFHFCFHTYIWFNCSTYKRPRIVSFFEPHCFVWFFRLPYYIILTNHSDVFLVHSFVGT